MGWFSWEVVAQLWIAAGFSTSCVYLLRHYLPNVKHIKNKMIESGIDVKNNVFFSKYRIIIFSISILTAFSLFSAPLSLGLFNPKELNKLDRDRILKKALLTA